MSMYMKIDGINGDVSAKNHQNWIALDQLLFDVKRSISTDPGRIADREGTRPAISDILVYKKMDKSSPLLFSESCVGKAKPQVLIHVCQTQNSLTPYVQFTLNNVIISRYDLAVEQEQERPYPREKVGLSFDKIEVRYTPFDSQNNPQSPIPAGYDLKEAIAS